MKNLATPLPPLFHWHEEHWTDLNNRQFFVFYFPLCWGRVYSLGKNPSGKSLSFCGSIFTPDHTVVKGCCKYDLTLLPSPEDAFGFRNDWNYCSRVMGMLQTPSTDLNQNSSVPFRTTESTHRGVTRHGPTCHKSQDVLTVHAFFQLYLFSISIAFMLLA